MAMRGYASNQWRPLSEEMLSYSIALTPKNRPSRRQRCHRHPVRAARHIIQPHALDVNGHEGVLLLDARLHISWQERPGIVARQPKHRPGQIVRPKAKEIRMPTVRPGSLASPLVTLDVISQRGVNAGLVAVAAAFEPCQQVRVQPQRRQVLHRAIEPAADGALPIREFRHVACVDLAVGHGGNDLQRFPFVRRQFPGVSHFRIPSAPALLPS
jgi:hypothetical protein